MPLSEFGCLACPFFTLECYPHIGATPPPLSPPNPDILAACVATAEVPKSAQIFSDSCFIQKSGLYYYQIFGTLDDVPPDVCAQVYMDIEYRRHWDSYVNGKAQSTQDAGRDVLAN